MECPPKERLNLLYIDCHDLGDWLGCYGHDYVRTGNLDGLALAGVRFDQHFSTSPICMPSRVSMYAGMYPHQAGCLGQMPYDQDTPMIGQRLAEVGYRTAHCGWNTKDSPNWAGYQRGRRQSSGENAARLLEELSEEGTDKPFFLHVSFGAVHRNFGQEYDEEIVDRIAWPAGYYEHEISRRDLGTLCKVVERLDGEIGEILEALDKSGARDRTLVVFTTEHGPAVLRAKHTLYDAGIKTALIMSCPGVLPADKVCTEMASSIDLVPTIYDFLGVEPTRELPGRSWRGLLEGEPSHRGRDILFAEHTWDRGGIGEGTANLYAPKRVARTQRYKLIRHFSKLPNTIDSNWLERFRGENGCLAEIESRFGTASPEYELFDLEKDPGELKNLAGDPDNGEAFSEMKQRLQKHLEETDDPILQGYVAHREGFEREDMWVSDGNGGYKLHPECPAPNLERGEAPFWYSKEAVR